ncbi:REP element-mobilizing transposase RayT [Virgibacillus halotolerans]|uniref:REP-associated tyrosine transposase n=1 Tax=Virgibacillus halotolerans TaxID=1071053 RepID=UPI00195F38FD|nr:REP element-mobilizing transposase RayT [Virgibacillus halotolerans]
MARKPRTWFPGAIYHITARGNRRDTMFYDAQDYQYYLDLIKACKQDIPFDIHAYCLMPNHIHLLLETRDDPPGSIFKFIHTRYAIHFNKRYELTGHVFQDRYHSNIIDSENYFLRASSYIHLNPVEAKIVRKPEHYFWSSYAIYLDETTHNPIVETKKILSSFQEPSRQAYYTYVGEYRDSPSTI